MTRAEQLLRRVAENDAHVARCKLLGIDPRSRRTQTKNERWLATHLLEVAEAPIKPKPHVKSPSSKHTPILSPTPDSEKPLFDVSSWKPTEAALALLARVDSREGRIKQKKAREQEACARAARAQKAHELELAYGSSLTHVDRVIQHFGQSSNNRYDKIESLAGKNGDCHSRKTTYRRWKFGRGNLTREGWEKQGFEENCK